MTRIARALKALIRSLKQFNASAQAQGPSGHPLHSARAFSSLDDMPCGVRARVLAVEGRGAVVRRLMEMGLVPGAPVRVIKAAPFGDPIEVCIRDYHLALRRVEAQTITVTASDI